MKSFFGFFIYATANLKFNPTNGELSSTVNTSEIFGTDWTDDLTLKTSLVSSDLARAVRGELKSEDAVTLTSLSHFNYSFEASNDSAKINVGAGKMIVSANDLPFHLILESDQWFGISQPEKFGLTQAIKAKFKPHLDVRINNENLNDSTVEGATYLGKIENSFSLSANGYSLTEAIRDEDQNFLAILVFDQKPEAEKTFRLLARKEDFAVMVQIKPDSDKCDVIGMWFIRPDMRLNGEVKLGDQDRSQSLSFNYENPKLGKINFEVTRREQDSRDDLYTGSLNIDLGHAIIKPVSRSNRQ